MKHLIWCLSLVSVGYSMTVTLGQPHPIIFDTDFALPPQDDALALLLALNSPEIEILGITTVAGNKSRDQATADALKVLEMVGCERIPVYAGAQRPLVHRATDYARTHWGEWWTDARPVPPLGAFARTRPAGGTAVEFMVQTVLRRPGEVTILAIGPLTNIAEAIRRDPAFSKAVKRMVIMGGAIAALPDGAGNITPNAEFNFWVDPEAARTVLRSGIPIELSPLNVSRKTHFSNSEFERIVGVSNPTTRLLKDTMSAQFQGAAAQSVSYFMYDQVAVASLIDPSLVVTIDLHVDVDIHQGIDYGVCVGGAEIWPGAEGASKVRVQYDLDWDRFIRLFVERLTSGRIGAP